MSHSVLPLLADAILSLAREDRRIRDKLAQLDNSGMFDGPSMEQLPSPYVFYGVQVTSVVDSSSFWGAIQYPDSPTTLEADPDFRDILAQVPAGIAAPEVDDYVLVHWLGSYGPYFHPIYYLWDRATAPLRWGKVQASPEPPIGAGDTNKDVTIKACDYDGSAVTGDAFTVQTPLRPRSNLDIASDDIVGYLTDSANEKLILTDIWGDTAVRRLELSTALAPAGSAGAYTRSWSGSAWTTDTTLFTVYDDQGCFRGRGHDQYGSLRGSYGKAMYDVSSAHWVLTWLEPHALWIKGVASGAFTTAQDATITTATVCQPDGALLVQVDPAGPITLYNVHHFAADSAALIDAEWNAATEHFEIVQVDCPAGN